MNHFHKASKFSKASSRENKMIHMVKAYNVNQIDKSKIESCIDPRFDQMSARKSSRNNAKDNVNTELVLPNLSKKPNVYDESIKSVDLKN